MHIQLLYFDSCPSYQMALQNLREVLQEEGLHVEVEMIRVETDEGAKQQRFLGSPTIRVDGVDIETEARKATDFSLRCRLYSVDGGISNVPSKEMIRKAICSPQGA